MNIGVQLYSLRERLETEFESIIAALAKAGAQGVEPWAGLPVPFEQAAAIFGQNGLACPSIHLPLLAGDDRQRWLDAAHALGVSTIVVPAIAPEQYTSLDGIKRAADDLNQSAEIAREAGFGYGYHNHWWEIQTVEGRPALYHLAELTAPDIRFELDLYWVQVGGLDPAQVVRDFGARASLLHLKDGPAQSYEHAMVACGEGAVDLPAAMSASSAAWGFVELDRCDTDMLEAVVASLRYLHSL
ncbi:MAG: sugar phosphate isomerase/epimerase [Chloroflexi bacterium]|jgi:sugar phosphate isomerase/epimerase|nr:sugar phosphate isomerase/epimerase [Chloroflexota bacterium]MBV6436056.1 hypothetical protein [Anaerolineae bacterium]MDL1917082.1 sugar phosphate isomerase/epimerase [Anaerolineae bacterium CFX4]OQY86633.1 MAG: hypothetical protein B6D42_00785 [Anaerolineae bacterium UTCFX5]MCC6567459.1 sugar phosphate isomerase/epimerase [Chloroflexota bacterium]